MSYYSQKQEGENNELNSNSLAKTLKSIQTLIFYNMGDPKLLPLRFTLNIMRGLIFIWIYFLMFTFKNYSTVMWLYLFMNGSYGICWLIKDMFFPDIAIRPKSAVGSHIVLIIILMAYACIPLPLAMGYGYKKISNIRMISIGLVYLTGMVLMMMGDYQKYKAHASGKMATTGLFKTSRNPNYLGELLNYTSFAMLTGNISGFLIWYSLGGPLFIMNLIIKQELSFKPKEGYKEYAQRSNIFLFKICNNKVMEWVVYVGIVGLGVWLYSQHLPKKFWWPIEGYKGGL